MRDRTVSGYGLAAAWADEWHHALHTVLTGERAGYYEDFGSMATLGKALRQAWVHDGTFSRHRDRVHGRPPEGLAGERFVIETQNHDQVGNRAAGERLSVLTTDGRLKIAAALLLTAPFTPLLFMGEEWGARTPFQYFTDHDDPELGAAVSTGRRHEFAAFGWAPEDVPDPQDRATFERSKLHWADLDDPRGAEMLSWYRRLVALRRATPELRDGRLDRVDVASQEDGLVVVRRDVTAVVANLGTEEHAVAAEGRRLVLASDPAVHLEEGTLTVPVDTVAVLAHH